MKLREAGTGQELTIDQLGRKKACVRKEALAHELNPRATGRKIAGIADLSEIQRKLEPAWKRESINVKE